MPRQPVKKSSTVIKALNILEAVGSSARAITLADVTDIVGIDRTTAYRLLSTLESAGYIHRSDDTKRYRLSYKIISLGRNLVSSDRHTDLIREALRELADTTNETATYAVLDGTEMVLLMQAKASQILAVDFKVGDRAGLHCSAIGKSVLAYQPEEFLEKVISQGLPKTAANTVTDPDALRHELLGIRARGFSVDDGEFNDELRCVAAPILETQNTAKSGIVFFGPKQRFTDARVDELSQAIVTATHKLSSQLDDLEKWQ